MTQTRSERTKRREEHRVLIDTVWRLGGPEAAQSAVIELGHSVRCPECLGQKQSKEGFGRFKTCACCLGAGVLKHRVRRKAPGLAFPGTVQLDASRRRWVEKRKR